MEEDLFGPDYQNLNKKLQKMMPDPVAHKRTEKQVREVLRFFQSSEGQKMLSKLKPLEHETLFVRYTGCQDIQGEVEKWRETLGEDFESLALKYPENFREFLRVTGVGTIYGYEAYSPVPIPKSVYAELGLTFEEKSGRG
ncbi:MAG: hypothetical protein N2558_02400 [Patescibacteria group bacterium]|nr:hypothetical protein [Patescibacteria group bacterium]